MLLFNLFIDVLLGSFKDDIINQKKRNCLNLNFFVSMVLYLFCKL